MTGVAEADYYTCALPFLITALRSLFLSPLAHAGVVQLAPWASAGANFNVEVAALRDAQLRDFQVTVLEDGCAAMTPALHDAAIAGLQPVAEIGSVSGC
jgi:hypothetical protein